MIRMTFYSTNMGMNGKSTDKTDQLSKSKLYSKSAIEEIKIFHDLSDHFTKQRRS